MFRAVSNFVKRLGLVWLGWVELDRYGLGWCVWFWFGLVWVGFGFVQILASHAPGPDLASQASGLDLVSLY